jgi:hypothetical protein
MCIFSRYKNIFGKENSGIHKIRFVNTAIIDYILSIGLAFLITFLTSFPLVLSTICVLVLGIILHILFGVQTSVIKFFGIKC